MSCVIISNSQIDYVAHGEDPCLDPEGNDLYGPMKEADRFKFIKVKVTREMTYDVLTLIQSQSCRCIFLRSEQMVYLRPILLRESFRIMTLM